MKNLRLFCGFALFLSFNLAWPATGQERSSQPKSLVVEFGGRVYELPQVLNPPIASTFFSLQLAQPPTPFNWAADWGLDVYSFNKALWVDDRAVDYVVLRANATDKQGGGQMSLMSANGAPEPPGEGGGGESEPIELPPAYSLVGLKLIAPEFTNSMMNFTFRESDTN